jgi:hypothetical protein
MEITIELLERYFSKSGYPIHIGFSINPPYDSLLSITAGKYEDYGSLRVFLTFEDINDILHINNILGDNGLLVQERDSKTTDYKAKETRMKDLVYGTLEKYIYQMLKASIGKDFFPEIKSLPKHDMYFRRNQVEV